MHALVGATAASESGNTPADAKGCYRLDGVDVSQAGTIGIRVPAQSEASKSSDKRGWLPGEHIPEPFHMRLHDIYAGDLVPREIAVRRGFIAEA